MEVRSLREEELERWFEHVDEVFAHTPRAYFERHYHNDPWRNLEGILVAVDSARERRIASTVRVFVRRVLVDGRQVPCGGIGEVSTKADYRKRGLASQLLQESNSYVTPHCLGGIELIVSYATQAAEEWMKEQGLLLSMLHTRAAAPLYRSLGWHTVPIHYTTITAPLASFIYDRASPYTHQMVDVTNTEQLQRIARVHKTYAQHFNGTFVRDSSEYWSKWIAYEFTRESAFSGLAVNATGGVVGYASCFIKGADDDSAITVRVREFGAVDALVEDDGGQTLLDSLVRYLLHQFLQSKAVQATGHVILAYPSAIESYFRLPAEEVVADSRREETVDAGTMIRSLDAPGAEQSVEKSLRRQPSSCIPTRVEQKGRSPSTDYLLFWEADSF